ncbi:MAG: hypothetical protein WBN55_08945, partial [Eudoraea sp.]|uniref:hypothetical protein n=1 Tax=Eudoraea sp. TaxID=1979955 RepID=UPI003C70DD88
LWPWSEKLARTIQLRYSDSWAVYNNLSGIYAFKRDMEAYKDLVSYAIQEQWLTKEEATIDKAYIQLMTGNSDNALNIFEEGFPSFANEDILSEELSYSYDFNFIRYIELLRINGQDQKANQFAEKLCSYYNNKIKTDNEVSNHERNKMNLECFYATDQKTKFLEELEEVYFVKKDQGDWFTNMKCGDYMRFEKDPEYQKLFRKIESEVHLQREEVIEFLKKEGDWDPGWDKELGLE